MKYSIIVPVFNSEESLKDLFLEMQSLFLSRGEPFEVIFVDDGSSDRSWEVIRELKQSHADTVRGIRLSRNFSQHNATLCGISYASGDFIITIDDDLQIPPGEIEKLIQEAKNSGADLVYGVFTKKKHGAVRNIGSRTIKSSSKWLNDSPGEGSSFRLMTRELADNLKNHAQNFLYIDEVLHWYTDNIRFVTTEHQPRRYKRSGYTTGKLINLVANLLLYYTTLPLKFLVYGGFLFSLITLGFVIYFIILKIQFNVPLGYTSLIVSILFSTSIILFSLGIIGEYLRRIYLVQNRKPAWSVRSMI